MRVPEGLQPLGLGQVPVKLTHFQANQTQQDVHAMGLLLGLSKEHDVILEGPGQQGCGRNGAGIRPTNIRYMMPAGHIRT